MKSQFCCFVVFSLVISALWPAAAQAGDPFTVNITTSGQQRYPDVAVGPDGRFAIVWEAENQDGNGWGMFARWFDWKGDAMTGEVPVNVTTLDNQYSPNIGADGQGRFVVAWHDNSAGIRVRRFDSFGVALSGEIDAVGTAPVPFAPSLSVNESGDFVVLWLAYDLPEIRVGARRFDSSGSPLGDAVEVAVFNRQPYTYNEGTAVAMLDDRSFIGVWSDGKEVFARRYGPTGNPIAGQFQVSQLGPFSFSVTGVDVASDDIGGYRIVWETDINLEESTTMTRTVNPTGILGGLTDLLLTTRDWPGPGFSMTGPGDFIVTRLGAWPYFLEARRLDKNLIQKGQYDVVDDLEIDWCAPRLDHGNGDSREFVVAWQETAPGDVDPDIRARVFSHAIFLDGFEAGNTSAWSVTQGG